MIALEAGLSQEHGKIKLPSLGYNGAQAAYCREQANTPNSVFPVFWWPINNELKKDLRSCIEPWRTHDLLHET